MQSTARAPRKAPIATRRPVACRAGLTDNARRLFEDLAADNSRVVTLDNIVDGFYISPKFLDKLTVHCAKNYMHKSLRKIKVPLILGVWGGKGQGKTFQVTLAFKAMNADPIIMSAGELEAGNAGEPAKLVRQRYREAGDLMKKNKISALFINDLDAGAGRFGESTQYTVNNQMVNATLMNIADNPTNVQLPGVYKSEECPRVPIICTGNDFSTLYAPLIRDGRMEKYYWNPTRADRIGVCQGIFKDDQLSPQEIEQLVDAFPGQTIDFFGALRARIYDDLVRGFTSEVGIESLGNALVKPGAKPVVLAKPDMTQRLLMDYGDKLVQEQAMSSACSWQTLTSPVQLLLGRVGRQSLKYTSNVENTHFVSM